MIDIARLPSAPVAALSLVAGYAVAAGSGVRSLGGAVLLAGLVGAVLLWRRRLSVARTAGLAWVFLSLFVASHFLARGIGAWPSVLLVAAVMFGVAWWLADRPDGDRAAHPRAVRPDPGA